MGQRSGWPTEGGGQLGRGLPLPPTSSPLAPLPEPVPTRALPCFFPTPILRAACSQSGRCHVAPLGLFPRVY